jgi:hypothetical protein
MKHEYALVIRRSKLNPRTIFFCIYNIRTLREIDNIWADVKNEDHIKICINWVFRYFQISHLLVDKTL